MLQPHAPGWNLYHGETMPFRGINPQYVRQFMDEDDEEGLQDEDIHSEHNILNENLNYNLEEDNILE